MHNTLHQQMSEDSQLRLAERMLTHLAQVEKTYKVEKSKGAQGPRRRFRVYGCSEEV